MELIDLTPEDNVMIAKKMREECGLPDIQSMRRKLFETHVAVLEQYLKPFDNANYIDCEIMRIRDIVQKAKD